MRVSSNGKWRSPTFWVGKLRRDSDGGIAIETAVIVLTLGIMMTAIFDFGLAFSRQMNMSNVVRAGTQFALVRRPSLGPSADVVDALNSLNTIRAAVVASADFLETDPGPDHLDVKAFCLCPDATPVTCSDTPAEPLPCVDRQTYIKVSLSLPFTLNFDYPGIDRTITIEQSASVRLN